MSGDAQARQYVYQWAKCVTASLTVLEEQMRPTPQHSGPAVSHTDVHFSYGFEKSKHSPTLNRGKLARMLLCMPIYIRLYAYSENNLIRRKTMLPN